MAPRVVHLHIGSTKTGTTFIQRVLWSNQKALGRDRVLLPAEGRYALGRAARALHYWDPAREPVPDEWHAVAETIRSSPAESAIASQEFFSWLDAEQVRGVVESLQASQVKVVLTARDLARLIPAQWQSSMRQRHTWTLTDYSHDVQHGPNRRPSPYRHFWHRLDYPAILQRWSDVVGRDNLTVVTVPASGSDPDELWRRFCTATDLDPSLYSTAGVTNASLGAASCEVLRRLNGRTAVKDMPREEYGVEINGTLTRRVLDRLGRAEPKITLPSGQRAWVMSKAEEIIAAVDAVGVRVVGSLDDLRPTTFRAPYQAPEELPVDDLLDAALDALAGLAVAHGSGGTAPKPGLREPRAGRGRRLFKGRARDARRTTRDDHDTEVDDITGGSPSHDR